MLNDRRRGQCPPLTPNGGGGQGLPVPVKMGGVVRKGERLGRLDGNAPQ